MTAPLVYEYPVNAAIKALKFRRKLHYVPALGALLEDARVRRGLDVDALVPVPLHHWRQALRGFNQADELCAAIARQSRLPIHRNVIRRSATRYQSGLDADARRRNLEGAFRVRGRLRSRRPLVVDDVVTTGATAGAVAATLLDAGACHVHVLAIARAVPRPR